MHEVKVEKKRIMHNPNVIIPSAFISFKSRWGAVDCAQTQQTSNPMKLMVAASMFPITFFFMIPIAFVQSVASIDGMQKVLVFLRPLIRSISVSVLEIKIAGKYHFFILVNVFFGSIITGTTFQQLDKFLHQPPLEWGGENRST
ncbi:hypothetical protein ACS0TY_034501 [Phlomoides rotata]